jgi:hypothetical protein
MGLYQSPIVYLGRRIRSAKIIVFFVNRRAWQQSIARSYDSSVVIFTIGFGEFYDENLSKWKLVTMRNWQNGRKSSISYDR